MASATELDCDVIVVGAGLAGLQAANGSPRRGLDVAVVEARERVGGRTLNHSVGERDDDVVELGGQWVGPTQHEIMARRPRARARDLPDELRRQEPLRGRPRQDVALHRHDPARQPARHRRLRAGGAAESSASPRRSRWTRRGRRRRRDRLDAQTIATWIRRNCRTAARPRDDGDRVSRRVQRRAERDLAPPRPLLHPPAPAAGTRCSTPPTALSRTASSAAPS